MADITFDQFLDEQKKTTGALNRLGKNLREQLLGDKSQERTDAEVAASNKAYQIRQEKAARGQEKIDSKSLKYEQNDDKRQGSMLKVAVGNLLAVMGFDKTFKKKFTMDMKVR